VRWLAFVLLCACGTEEAPRPPRDDPPDESETPAPHAVDPPPGRLRRVEGSVTIDGAVAAAGATIDSEVPIEVSDDGRAVLQLRDGGAVTLDGGSRAWLIEEGAAQLLLVRGAAHAAQPPSGSSPRPPLRIVTPSATAEIGQAGELFVVLFDGGASWVVALAGGVSVSVGEADARRRLRTVDLIGGQAVAVPNRIAEPTEGPRRLDAARLAAVALAVPPPEPEAPRLERDLASEARRLDEALRWLETETRRGRELTTRHRTAVSEGAREDAERLQRELVGHSQELYRLRQLATARWERLRAQWLRLAVIAHAPADDPVAQRRERVVGLLGL
jgi:hypothetical protein